MTKQTFGSSGFLLLNCEKDNLFCEFILNKGFCDGYTGSQTYHFHSSYEVHVPVSGNFHLLIEDRDVFLEPGTVCVIPPNSIHYVFGDRDAFRISYRFRFSQSGDENKTPLSLFRQAYEQIQGVCVTNSSRAYEKYASLAAENLRRGMSDVITSELLFLATHELAAVITGAAPAPSPQPERGPHSAAAEEIEEFFNRHYLRPIRAEDLAKHLNFSVRHTERIMRRMFGLSFNQMLSRKRLITAKLLLRITAQPISDIASQMGFQSESYFYRKFTKAFGTTPGRYRAACRQAGGDGPAS